MRRRAVLRCCRESSTSARPSSSDVASGFSTSTCLPASSAARVSEAVLVHARQHEDDVDVICTDHALGVGEIGTDVEPPGGSVPLPLVDVVDGADVDPVLCTQPVDHADVRSREDASAAENPIPRLMAPRGQRRSTRPSRPGCRRRALPRRRVGPPARRCAGNAVIALSRGSARSPPGARSTVAPLAAQIASVSS